MTSDNSEKGSTLHAMSDDLKRWFGVLALPLLAAAMLVCAGCEDEGPVEEAVEEIDQDGPVEEAAEETADEVEEAADEVEEELD